MARGRPRKWAIGLIAVILILSVSVWVYARTIVTKTGPCEVTVECNIAIWGPNATQALADRWEKTVSSKFNGPSSQLVAHVAKANGQATPNEKADWEPNDAFKNSKKLAEDFLKDIGMDSAYVNCCRVKFKINVKLKSDIKAGDKTPYHTVKVMPQFRTVTKADGTTERVEFRDFVRVPGGDLSKLHKQSTTGEWSDVTGHWAAEAHETGHLMGLDDKYTEDATGCHTVPGHETDVMNNNWGAPYEAAIAEIVKLGGVECNCCKKSLDDAWVSYGQFWRPATDAILTCDEERLKQALADVNDQITNLGHYAVSLQQRYDLYKHLKDLQNKIKKALEDCPKRDLTTGGLSLTDGIMVGGRLSYDSSEDCQSWGGGLLPPTLPPTMPPTVPSGPLVTPPGPLSTPPPGISTPTPLPEFPPLAPTIPLYPDLVPPIFGPRPEVPGIPVSVGQQTPTTTTPGEPTQPVTTTPPPTKKPPGAKVYKSVLDTNGKTVLSAMHGVRMKVDLFAVPALPVAGTVRPVTKSGGNQYQGEPIISFSNNVGRISFDKKKQTGQKSKPGALLAGISEKHLPGEVVADISSLAAADTSTETQDGQEPNLIKIIIPEIRSYIVKLKINRTLEKWNDPAAYLTDKTLKPYIKRHWIVEDSMYVVFNFPVVAGN